MATKPKQSFCEKAVEFLQSFSFFLALAVLASVVVFPIRVCSQIKEVRAVPGPPVEKDSTSPYNIPLLESGFRVDLEDIEGSGWDLLDLAFGYGFYLKWDGVSLYENGTLVVDGGESLENLRFQFRYQISTAGGSWRGESGRVVIRGSDEKVIEGTPGHRDEEWGGIFGVSGKTRMVSPYFRADIPAAALACADESSRCTLPVLVEVTAEFPAISGTTTYRDGSRTLSREIELIVLSGEDAAAYHTMRSEYFWSHVWSAVLFYLAIYAGMIVLLVVVSKTYRTLSGRSAFS